MSVASDASRIALDEIIPRYWRASGSKRSSSASTSAKPTIVVSGPLKSCASIAMRSFLTWLSSTTASRRDGQLLVQLHVARGDREILAQQPQREDVRGAERVVALDVEHVGRAAARARDAHRGALLELVEDAHVAARRQRDERVGRARSSSCAQVGGRDETAARARRVERSRAPSTSSCTPDSSASTSMLGSSDANSVRAIEVIAVSRSFCIVSCTPRSTCSVTSRCTIT